MESYIKRELRSLGDVQIVGNTLEAPPWRYMISITGLEQTYESGRKTGSFLFSYAFFEIIPYFFFIEPLQDQYKQYPAFRLPLIGIASYPVDDLERFQQICCC